MGEQPANPPSRPPIILPYLSLCSPPSNQPTAHPDPTRNQYDQTHNRYGQPPLPHEKYDDLADIDRILNLPDQALHRDVDKIVLSANSNTGGGGGGGGAVKTAIVAPPTIYGFGRGPVNTTSMQVPALVRYVLAHGYAPVIGEGRAEWDHVHVRDLSALLTALVEAAIASSQGQNKDQDQDQGQDAELFGPRAYYFCESGTHVWGPVAARIGQEAVRQGFLKEVLTREVRVDELSLLGQSWGTNSKSVASRARKYLGWRPTAPSFEDEIPGAVEWEATRMGVGKAV